MTSITEPQPVLQKAEISRRGNGESDVDDGMKGKLKRDTISGKLRFWSGHNGNGNVKKNEGFNKMDEENSNADVEFDKDFDMEKDMGEWEDQKFSYDASADPLNWSPHRKTLAFVTLCLAFSIVGMQRLMFVSVNAVIATQFSISSTQTAALTGIAFIFSAISSPLWEMLSMKEAQLPIRLTILSTVDLFFTWGTPIVGGYLSQTLDGYGNQIMVMNIIQALSILLLILAYPETSFTRTSHPSPPTSLPPTGSSITWLKTLHLMPYWGNPSKAEISRPLKQLISPITLLTFVLAALPIASAYAFALSLSSFLSASPLLIFPSQVGYIFIGPFLLSIMSYGLLSIMSPGKPFTSSPSSSSPDIKLGGSATSALRIAIPGLILFATGTIAFSQYVSATLIPKAMEISGTVFVVSNTGMDLSLKVISLVFGILVAGAATLGFAVERYLSVHEGARENGRQEGKGGRGLERAHNVLRNLFTGVLVIAMPRWIEGGMGMEMAGVMGLRDTGLGVGVLGSWGGWV